MERGLRRGGRLSLPIWAILAAGRLFYSGAGDPEFLHQAGPIMHANLCVNGFQVRAHGVFLDRFRARNFRRGLALKQQVHDGRLGGREIEKRKKDVLIRACRAPQGRDVKQITGAGKDVLAPPRIGSA